MAFSIDLVGRLCLFSILCYAAVAAPFSESTDELGASFNETAVLNKRVPGDANNPWPRSFDTTGWPNIAEENCFAMLCLFNGQRTWQRVANANAGAQRYTLSGARYVPFQAGQLPSRHTSQINTGTTSAEEFPWRSIQQPNNGVPYVFPCTPAEQNSQGGNINGAYRQAGANIAYGDWFTITFTGAGAGGQYCRALFSNPPDFSVCTKQTPQTLFGTANVNIANFAYQVVKTASPFVFVHVAGPNKGKVTKRDTDQPFNILTREPGNEEKRENMETDFILEELAEAAAETDP